MAAPDIDSQIIPTQDVQEGTSGKGLKIAIGVLILILIVILSEVGYLVFSGYGRTFFESKVDSTLLSQDNTSPQQTTPTLPIEQIQYEPMLDRYYLNTSKIVNFASRMESIEENSVHMVDRVSIDFVFSGFVKEISSIKKDVKLGQELPYYIRLADWSDNDIEAWYTSEEISNSEIYLVSVDKEPEAITFDDIKLDDYVTIKNIINAFDNNPNDKLIFQVVRDKSLYPQLFQ